MFIVGDYIVYWDKDGSQWPGKILHIHEILPTIFIEINHINGDRKIWVHKKNLTHQ